MAAVIGALRAELSASIAQFQSDFGKAADTLKGFSKTAKTVAHDLDTVGRSMAIAITAPLTLLAKASYDSAKEARQAIGQVEAALISSGGASGKTAQQLDATAEALASISIYNKTDILRNVTAQLLTFGNIQGPVFDKAQKAVINLASRLGEDLESASIKVGRALNDPIQGVMALTRVGVQFTTQQKLQIKALVQSGDGLKAQQIILDTLTQKYGGAAEALRAASPDARLAQAWDNFKTTLGEVIDKIIPPLLDGLTNLLNTFQRLPEPIQKAAVVVGAILAVIGPFALILGSIVKVAGIVTPIIAGLAGAFAGLSLPVIAVVAGLAAVVTALIIFWKSVKDILHGDFTKAWQDAKDTATGIVNSILDTFHKLTTPQKIAPPVIAPGGGGGAPTSFDPHNEAELAKTAAAAKTLQQQLDATARTLAQGFDEIDLPKSTVQANALNAKLDEYVKTAQEAGVNTKGFAAQVAALRTRIAELQKQGLAKEALEFGQAVDADQLAVDRFSKGGLPPLAEKLQAVDDNFKSLKDNITDQITKNAALAASNDDARKTMERLQAILASLADAHKKATAAAVAQAAAEQKLADLQTQANNLDTRNQIRDLNAARGTGKAPISTAQQDLQAANDQLAAKQIEVAQNLTKLEEERDALVQQNVNHENDAQIANLNSEIDLQSQLFDLVKSTTGQQLMDAKRINEAFQQFTDDLTNQLSDMIANWSFSLKGLMGIFRQLAEQLFIKPVVSAGSDIVSGLLKDAMNAFAGGFAAGGYVPPGQWAVVGEKGPEIAYGGHSGMDVTPNGVGGGLTQVFNINTPDANSFRRSQRQIQREAKTRLAIA